MKLIIDVPDWKPDTNAKLEGVIRTIGDGLMNGGVPLGTTANITLIDPNKCQRIYRCELYPAHRGVCTLQEVP